MCTGLTYGVRGLAVTPVIARNNRVSFHDRPARHSNGTQSDLTQRGGGSAGVGAWDGGGGGGGGS